MKHTPQHRIEVTLEYFAEFLHYLSRSGPLSSTPSGVAWDMKRAIEAHFGALAPVGWEATDG